MNRLVVGVLVAVGLLVLLGVGGIDPASMANPLVDLLSECGGA